MTVGEITGGQNGKLQDGRQKEFLWDDFSDAATIQWAVNDGYADAQVQFEWVSGTPTLALEGTNLASAAGAPEGAESLKNAAGTPISAASTDTSKIHQLQFLPKYFRPKLTGSGTVRVLVTARGRG